VPVAANNPTLLVSWSHTEPGWNESQARHRRDAVLRLTNNLRDSGIDADLDLNQPGGSADWTRWGPSKIKSSDFVLIVGSPAWNRAWAGEGDMTKGAGAAAEADALKSLYNADRDAFRRKVRIVFLPGTPADVPFGLDGIERYRLDNDTPEALSVLIRDLSRQPAFPKQPLGKLPNLPPNVSWRDGTPVAAPEALRPAADHVAGAELRYTTIPGPVPVRWRDQWPGRDSQAETVITVHVVPFPLQPVPVRRLAALSTSLAGQMRATGLFDDADALSADDDADAVTVTTAPGQRYFSEMRPGKLRGLRVDRAGQVSAWHSLPSDTLGSALDEASAAAAIKDCLLLAAAVGIVQGGDLALALEISPVTMLAITDVTNLGRRSGTGLAFTSGPNFRRIEPDELVEARALSDGAEEAAQTLASLMLRTLKVRR